MGFKAGRVVKAESVSQYIGCGIRSPRRICKQYAPSYDYGTGGYE
jgi:hypothetical protein